MSISPFNSCFGGRIGFGFGFGQSSDRQTTSYGGHVKSLPFRGGLHACAGSSVIGAVPHIVKKNIGIIASLFIWVPCIVLKYTVYHN